MKSALKYISEKEKCHVKKEIAQVLKKQILERKANFFKLSNIYIQLEIKKRE